jgi:LysR family transcriptional regulator for bpeEF and oprC
MVTCGAPTYLAEHGTPLTLDDLATHRAVAYFAGRSPRTIDWHFLVDGEDRAVKVRPGILVNETEAFIACVLAGMGLIQAVGAVIAEYLKAGRLIEVLPETETVERAVSVMYPNRQHLAPRFVFSSIGLSPYFHLSKDSGFGKSDPQLYPKLQPQHQFW